MEHEWFIMLSVVSKATKQYTIMEGRSKFITANRQSRDGFAGESLENLSTACERCLKFFETSFLKAKCYVSTSVRLLF